MRNRVVLLSVILLSGLVATLVAQSILAYRDYPFDADEANHANGGLAIALDLRNGDLRAAATSFYQQGYYPPAFSALKALVFLIFGASPLVGRLFSLACLLAAMPAIYQTAQLLDEQWGWLIGLIAVGLTLISQPLLVDSALVMMEAPGLLASFGMLWLYLKATEEPTARWLVGASLMLLVVFLTKYTFGLPSVATVVAMEATLLLSRQEGQPRSTAKRWLCLFGPFALGVAIWFAEPHRIVDFWSYATARPANLQWDLEALIFYPRSIAFHYTPSPLFALITSASVVWALCHWHSPKVRLVLIYFSAGMGEMLLNLPNNPRFIETFVPAAHVLTGAMLAWCAASWPVSPSNRRWGIVLTLLVAVSLVTAVPLLTERFKTYPSVMETAYETSPTLNDLAAWITDQIPPGERFYIINYWDQFGPQALAWYLGTHEAQTGIRFADVSMPYTLLREASPENISALRDEIRESSVRFVVAFEGTPSGEPVWWLYADALTDALSPIARDVTYIELYDTEGWLKRSLLRQDEWERVKANSRYTLQVQTTIYAVATP